MQRLIQMACVSITPNRIDGWINQAECLCELHGAEKAVEALLLDEERFKSLLDISLRLDATTPWLMRYNEQESTLKGLSV